MFTARSIVSKISPLIPVRLLNVIRGFRNSQPLYKRQCCLCEYSGYFACTGSPPRIDAQCPSCGSLERHRLFWLWLESGKDRVSSKVLHFAPEKVLESKLREMYEHYFTADLYQVADARLNIEKIELQDCSVGTVICNHVLEHVDDKKALNEIFRILSPGGYLIASVPMIFGWARTYEDTTITDPVLREVHFGQKDHVRFYGRDFKQRLTESGFEVAEEYVAEGPSVVMYGLNRGETLFICRKK